MISWDHSLWPEKAIRRFIQEIIKGGLWKQVLEENADVSNYLTGEGGELVGVAMV
jgi:hypothetical protein